jgi:magnesium transporter
VVAESATWIDLLDPDRAELDNAVGDRLHPRARDQLLKPAVPNTEPRPTLESHGDYVYGVFLVPVVDGDRDTVYYQEVDLVMTATLVVSARKTPPGYPAFDTSGAQAVYHQRGLHVTGMLVYHLVDDIAERYLDLTDAFNGEIDELEDHVNEWPAERIRARLTGLRHDLLHIRSTLGPTRDAVRKVVDDRIHIEGRGLFSQDTSLHFADAYDKLLRAYEGLELSRDLIAGVRDYHQAKIANDQNEVMKTLTVIASVLLLPTFIVGLYGQNFHSIPELRWHIGYAWSWFLIIATTIGQLWWYRRKHWI